jgi:hypothetical protein
MRFFISPFDWCITSKMIDGKQCTIMCYIDNLTVSPVNESITTTIIGMINNEFGKEVPLTITRWEIHDYLGMKLDYSRRAR